MVERDFVRHAIYLYTDYFRGCFQEKLDPFLLTFELAEPIYPGREESPVG